MAKQEEDSRMEELKRLIVESEDASDRERLLEEFSKEVAKRSVRPMHLCIEQKDIKEEYDAGAFVLAKGGGYMHYMTKGGYHVLVSPEYVSMYNTMDLWLGMLKKNEGKPEEHSQEVEDVSDFLSSLLFANTVIFSDEEFMLGQFKALVDYVKQLSEKSENKLLDEDFEANREFENGVKDAENTARLLNEFVDNMEKNGEMPS